MDITPLPSRLSSYRPIQRLQKGISIFPLVARLRSMRGEKNPGELVQFALHEPIIRPAQVPQELNQLAAEVAGLKPRSVLEIGTFQGGTLFVFCRLSQPEATIISVDLPGGDFGGGYKWFRKSVFKFFPHGGQRLHLLREDSHSPETKNKVRAILGEQKLDLLFIDGDHTYDGVRADFELYCPLVRRGGLIVFHDIVEHPPAIGCEVSRFWNEIKLRYRHREIIADPRQGWAGLGLLYV